MRTGAFLPALLAAFLLAGCTSTSQPAADAPGGDGSAPATTVEERDMPFGEAASADAVAFSLASENPFQVDEGVLRMTAEAEWNCVSLCPIEAFLRDPSGDIVAEASGGSSLTLTVDNPRSGDWSFAWKARDQASAGVEGNVHFTFESLA